MSLREDAEIECGQMVTIGTAIDIAIDWTEMDGQSFGISSCTIEVFDEDDTSVVASQAGTVTTGINSVPRTVVALSAVDTGALSAGVHYARWSLVLSDGQTRIVDQAIMVRNP